MSMAGGQASGRVVIPLPNPVVVPADYVGATFRGWPVYNAAWYASHAGLQPTSAPPAPTSMQFGFVRIGGEGATSWFQLELTAGSYDATALAALDLMITTHRSAGRTVMFNLAYTPRFYASTGDQALPPGSPTLEQGNGAYPASTSPNGLTALGNVVTMLITRYNTAGGAWGGAANGGSTNFAVLGKGIQYLELWNEANWAGYPGFFWGTPSQMVDMCVTARTAAKAVDSAITFVPSSNQSAFQTFQFLTATGAINTGVHGGDVADMLTYHVYNSAPLGSSLEGWNRDFLTDSGKGLLSLKAYMASAGYPNIPVMNGECGFDESSSSAALTAALAQPASWRKAAYARQMAIGAAYGLKKWVMYCWECVYACYPMNDPNGVPAALTLIHQKVAGKTIAAASYLVGGEVTLTFSDGTTFTV